MKFRMFSSAILFVTLMMCVVSFASAQEKSASPEAKKSAANPDMEAMMQMYLKFATPGPAHKQFEQFVGKWEAVNRVWMDPKQPPNESKATAECRLILGGRYLVEEYQGEFMGMPFQGMGITGYDNFKKQYSNFWVDTMGTATMNTLGTIDEAGKVITYIGKMDEPVTGEKDKKIRMVAKIIDNDKHILEMYDTIPGLGEVKVMEITYTRKK